MGLEARAFCSVSAARSLAQKELLQVAALFEQQDDFLELAEHEPLRLDGAEIANRLVGKSRGRDQEPAEIGAAVERDQVGGKLPEVERPVRPPKFYEEKPPVELDEDCRVIHRRHCRGPPGRDVVTGEKPREYRGENGPASAGSVTRKAW